jgi:hypothetical protein
MGWPAGLPDSNEVAPVVNPVFAVAAVLGVLLPLLPSKGERTQRRLYWIGAVIASVSAFFAIYPPDWGGGLGLGGALAAGLVIRAYMSTSHIRFRGRTYAFNPSDSQADDAGERSPTTRDADYDPAPDSYAGFATAAKTWWLFALLMTGCAFIVAIFITQREGPWYALGTGAVIVLVAVLAGHQDASWGSRVARGQLVQFAVAGVVTLGIFTALYLLAYAAAKRWPVRPKGSMEYRAHPHLRKKFPDS